MAGGDSLSLLVVFLTALAVGYSGALMPGPLLTMVVAESARDGARVGPLSILGHALLELALLGGLALGLTQALSGDLASGVIGVAGGAVMLWMGVGMVRDARRGRLEAVWDLSAAAEVDGPADQVRAGVTEAALRPGAPAAVGSSPTPSRAPWRRHVAQGALLSFSNPYWSLWWATIGAAYVVSAAALGPWGIVAFFIGHITADFTWYGLVSSAVAYGRRFLSPAFYRRLVMVCGLFLVGLAVYFVQWGFRAVA